jgi:hypothetical protein
MVEVARAKRWKQVAGDMCLISQRRHHCYFMVMTNNEDVQRIREFTLRAVGSTD